MGIVSKLNSLIKRSKSDDELTSRPFVDLADQSKLVKCGLSRSRCPKWLEVSPGINFYGRCKNPECDAHLKNVRCRWGFGIFILEKDLDKIKCTVCSEVLQDVQTCGFIGTYWRYCGIKSEDSSEDSVQSCKWRKATIKYNSKFILRVLDSEGKSKGNDLIFWKSLTIEAISPERYKKENKWTNIFKRAFKI